MMNKEDAIKICNEKGKIFVDTFKKYHMNKNSNDSVLKDLYKEVKELGLNNKELINNFFFPKDVSLYSCFNNEYNYSLFNDYVNYIDKLGVFSDGLIIPDKVTKIIDNPFRHNGGFGYYRIDDSIWFISIRHRRNIKKIFLGENVATICPLAFRKCEKLEYLYISRSVKLIMGDAISAVPKLKNIYLYNTQGLCIYGNAFDFKMVDERAFRSYNVYFEGSREDFANLPHKYIMVNPQYFKITYNVSPEVAKEMGVLIEYEDLLKNDDVYLLNTSLDDFLDNEADGEYAENVSEGLIKCIKKYAKVDIGYIASICRCDASEVVNKLGKSIYLDPDCFNGNYYEGWKTSDEYLSGNIFYKLNQALKYNELYPHLFDKNIESLKELLPSGIDNSNIYYQISSPWLPKNIIKEYIMYLLGVSEEVYDEYVTFDHKTSLWKISSKINHYARRLVNHFSTKRMSVVEILTKVLNLSDIKVYDSYFSFDVVKNKETSKQVLNYKETMLAEEKGKLLENDFRHWCENIGRKTEEINKRYNELFGYVVNRKYDGSFLDFSEMNLKHHLFDHQKDAVARILFTPNTLLAHNVGTGKTFVIASAIMQLRKTGLSKKNLIVVPNNIISQWESIFKDLYPNANLYVVTPKDFTTVKKQSVLKNIQNNDYDAIIMGFSSFDLIPPYRDVERRKIKEELNKYASYGTITKSTQEKINKLNERLSQIDNDKLYENVISYNDLGVDRLFVDEAHNYKNIPLHVSAQFLRGINADGSKKCENFLSKVDITTSNPNGGVILATGTPITNSISDCYAFQRFLQNGELKLVDINSFNDWIATFTEKETEVEIDFDSTNYHTVTRLSRFHNLPELSNLFSNVADFYDNESEVDLPDSSGYIDVKLENSSDLRAFLRNLTDRIEKVRKHEKREDEEKDNMLKIISDGRKASVDLRLINRIKYAHPEDNKIDALCKNVSDIYFETIEDKSTQLIFLDLSVYRDDFNLYSLIREQLVNEYNIPSDQIKFVHEATSEKERQNVFRKVNKGEVRILLGSTQKLGTGVNVQERLIAIHHVDVPWRPADMVQRNGRIVRQGNCNKMVRIYRYIKEGSFDAYSWQTLEIKQSFINSLLSNSIDERSKDDISDVVLDYAEAKALAMGDSRLKDCVLLKNEISRLSIINQKTKENYQMKRKNLIEIPSQIKNIQGEIDVLQQDIDLYNENNKSIINVNGRRKIRELIDITINSNIDSANDVFITDYKGFKMYVPSGMHFDKKFVMLKGIGKYFIEIKTKAGSLEIIDNFLDGLVNKKSDKEKEIIDLNEKSIQIKELLENKKLYDDEIIALKQKLHDLEKELKIINE